MIDRIRMMRFSRWRMSHCIRVLAICIAAQAVPAAQPVTINFEDIFNKPFNQNLPSFVWRGVRFTGGGLYQYEGPGNVLSNEWS